MALEKLAREIVRRKAFSPRELREFLASAEYINAETLCKELFPNSHPADEYTAGELTHQNISFFTSSFSAKTQQATNAAYSKLIGIMEISETAAIMEAWRLIEITTKQVADAYQISIGGQIPGVKAIRELIMKHKMLPQTVVATYEEMRRTRSRAAHTADFEISKEDAARYIETAYRFYISLLFLLAEAAKLKKANR